MGKDITKEPFFSQPIADVHQAFQNEAGVLPTGPALIGAVASKQRFTILSEQHNQESKEFQTAPLTYWSASKMGGVDHVGMEIPRDFQGIIDRYQEEDISIETVEKVHDILFNSPLVENHSELSAKAIRNADLAGLNIHAIDVGHGILSKEDRLFYEDHMARYSNLLADIIEGDFSYDRSEKSLYEAVAEEMGAEDMQRARDLQDQIYQAKEKDHYKFIKSRMAMDDEIAAHIQSRIGPDEKMLIQIGGMHASRAANDLDYHLGENQTATIELHRSRASEQAQDGDFLDRTQNFFLFGTGTDEPEHKYYLADNLWVTKEGEELDLNTNEDFITKLKNQAQSQDHGTSPPLPQAPEQEAIQP